MINTFIKKIKEVSQKEGGDAFKQGTNEIELFVNSLPKSSIIELVELIGTIPEQIIPSSSEEKYFAKAGDIISAKALEYLGLKSKALDSRGDAGDVIATSKTQNYSLIGDAKSFRLSRTAKNQKDFKVKALSKWREDCDYAVLFAPFFQYPTKKSQIYLQSTEENVLLFSWEHLAILLKLDIIETDSRTLEQLWNFPKKYSRKVSVANSKNNFFKEFNKYFIDLFDLSKEQLSDLLELEITSIKNRAQFETKYLKNKINDIKNYSREKAIEELLKQINIESKMIVINRYVESLNDVKEKYIY